MSERDEKRKDLKSWLGKDWKNLSDEEKDSILSTYDDLTKSELREARDTISKIYQKEFDFGIVAIGSLYGITLSILATKIGEGLDQLLGSYGSLLVTLFLFIAFTLALMYLFKAASRDAAKHWKLLEALRLEAEKRSQAQETP